MPEIIKELENRKDRLISEINAIIKEWDSAVIIGKVNQFYLTGTMQDGVVILKKNGDMLYFVRKSFERAKVESPLKNIYPYVSFRDVASVIGDDIGITLIEEETMPIAYLSRMQKYLKLTPKNGLEGALKYTRAVKSDYELDFMKESGRQHAKLLDEIVPTLLVCGMSEFDFGCEVIKKMTELGYHGLSRFSAFQAEVIGGQFAFGDNVLFPSSFNGPAGYSGLCAAAPVIGSRDRLLKKGDLVFADVSYGYMGYHTDRTQVYSFNKKPSDSVMAAHKACMDVALAAAKNLKTGAIPSQIYAEIMGNLPDVLTNDFMGKSPESVKFIGHGVGLVIDEYPVLARGFDRPLIKNMTLAIEPKKALDGIGLVGVEDTYVVTDDCGLAITGGSKEIIVV